MINLKNILALSACAVCSAGILTVSAPAQARERVVKTTASQPTNLPTPTKAVEKVKSSVSSRPILTNEIKVENTDPAWEPLVEKTASSNATSATSVAAMVAAGKTTYDGSTSIKLDNAIKSRYGVRYRYGSIGPNSYDCSGFVWSAFQEAGIDFTRASARSLWSQSVPVEGDERYKFGTLVFLNGLGHMGIVADENGFYHASSSKGITYSSFKGYWSNRIVGFRRLVPAIAPVKK